MIAEILLAHAVGDYVLQSHWMATRKINEWWPAVVHGVTYTLPFLLITQSIPALLIIAGTHVIIDRYRLAKYVVWLKNQIAPKAYRYPLKDGWVGGFQEKVPSYLAVWLMIIVDNVMHILINIAAISTFG